MSLQSTSSPVPRSGERRCSRAPSRWLRALVAVALLSSTGGVAARAEEAPEYALKAAFLYNFAKFATWPEHSFADRSAPLQFCTLGDAPFGTAWDALGGKHVRDRSLVARKILSAREAAGCHVLFVSEDRETQIESVLDVTRARPVLTVGESKGFCKRGGIVNFVTLEGKVQFEINPRAAEGSGIRLSAQLLRLARVVPGEKTAP